MRRTFAQCDWLVPVIFLCVMAIPVITYTLPAYQSYISEEYQPLRALKFMSSFGSEYHKWGPMPNFLLAPGYALSLGYWYLTGSFSNPSDEFPYGLAHPLEQLTFLIVQGRILFFALGIVSLVALLHALRRITVDRTAILIAVMLCLATNIVAIRLWPSTKPDGPMLTFAALALAVYVRIVCDGFTMRRGVWMSIFAACAVSSKELAAMMFVLPYLALAWTGWRGAEGHQHRSQFTRSYAASIGAGIITYALLNIVYAPAVWWRRITYWTAGMGKDPEVWGGQVSGAGYALNIISMIVNNLGPGGTLIVAVALIAALVRPARKTLMLALPAIGLLVLGLLPMGYVHDRFSLGLALALIPPVVVGLSHIRDDLGRRPGGVRYAWWSLVAIAILCNINFSTFTWHQLATLKQASIDRYVQAHLSRDERIHIFSLWAVPPGKERLPIFGYTEDGRSIIEIMQTPDDRPEWILTDHGSVAFLDDARRFPGRAAMLMESTGLNIDQWRGVEGLGYRLHEELIPATPWWFLFDWMPAPREHRDLGRLLVYRRVDS